MKKTYFVLCIIAFFCMAFLPIYGQTNEIPTELLSALNSGDSKVLNTYMDADAEIIFPKVGCKTIDVFFQKQSVQQFTLVHQSVKDAGSFLIGTLNTKNGNFRVNILLRSTNGQIKIQQLRIEKL